MSRRPARRATPAATLARLEAQLGAVEYLVHVTAGALLRALEAGVAHQAHGLAPFLASLRVGLSPFMAAIPGGRHVTRPTPAGVIPGVCAFCGCTDALACRGGCAWANAERTICTRCDGEHAALGGPPGGRQGRAPGHPAPRSTAAPVVAPGRARPAGKGSRPAGKALAASLARSMERDVLRGTSTSAEKPVGLMGSMSSAVTTRKRGRR